MTHFKTLDIQATLLGEQYYGWNRNIDNLEGTDTRLVNVTKSKSQFKALTFKNSAKIIAELKDDNDVILMSFSQSKDKRVNIFVNPEVDTRLL